MLCNIYSPIINSIFKILGKPNPKLLDQDHQKAEVPEKDKNIGVNFHCKGGLLTFSFHVKANDQIKCYLFW